MPQLHISQREGADFSEAQRLYGFLWSPLEPKVPKIYADWVPEASNWAAQNVGSAEGAGC